MQHLAREEEMATTSMATIPLIFSIPTRSFHGSSALCSPFRTESKSKRIAITIAARMEGKHTTSRQAPDGSSLSSGQTGGMLSLFCPLLKLIGGGDPSAPRNHYIETATSGIATLARLPWGSKVLPEIVASDTQPPKALQLYEFEACPFCRRVREALTELDVSVEVYPCPKGSIRHRQVVREVGGKEQFPFLIDPNMGISLYESGDIVRFLFKIYGGGRSPSAGLLESTLVTGWVPTILRAGRGMALWQQASQNLPKKKLELYSYENNQFARMVREALCELEMPYILHNVGKGSRKLTELQNLSGAEKVPFFLDPNTGAILDDYQRIISYLFKTYRNTDKQLLSI